MAGIGFELRKITAHISFWNYLRAYLSAGIFSSGAWLISTAFLVAIYLYLDQKTSHPLFSIQFLVAITYLVSASLMLSGIFQQSLNRYISDKIFENKHTVIVPTILAASLILLLLSVLIGYPCSALLLHNQPFVIQLIMASSFVTLNMSWLFSNALTGLKKYRFVIFSFLMSYAGIFLLAIELYPYHLTGLLISFYIGQVLLLTAFYLFLLRNFPVRQFFHWEILRFMKHNIPLVLGGVLFHASVWIDKYLFWINPKTSLNILGSLRASPIYDMPMFLAFLFTVPGVAMFFYEMEAQFSRYYHRYYDAVREGGTLDEIHEKHFELVAFARNCFIDVIKIQAITATLAILFAPEILNFLKLAPIYTYLLRIDIIASCLLVFLISLINLLYYLDNLAEVFYITLLFFTANFLFTILSFYIGPFYYGYGFVLALLCSNLLAILILNSKMRKLTFHTFMFIK